MAKQLEIRTVYQGEEIILDSGRVNTVDKVIADPVTKDVPLTITTSDITSLDLSDHIGQYIIDTSGEANEPGQYLFYPDATSTTNETIFTGTETLSTANFIANNDTFFSVRVTNILSSFRLLVVINGTTVFTDSVYKPSFTTDYQSNPIFLKAGDSVLIEMQSETNQPLASKIIRKFAVKTGSIELLPRQTIVGPKQVNYSLSEQDTGMKFLDGRPIYQRSFTRSALMNANVETIYATGLPIMYVINSWYNCTNNFDGAVTSNSISARYLSGNLIVVPGTTGTNSTVTIQYVKD